MSLGSVFLLELYRSQFTVPRLADAVLCNLVVEVSDPLAQESLYGVSLGLLVPVKCYFAYQLPVLLALLRATPINLARLAYHRCPRYTGLIHRIEAEPRAILPSLGRFLIDHYLLPSSKGLLMARRHKSAILVVFCRRVPQLLLGKVDPALKVFAVCDHHQGVSLL